MAASLLLSLSPVATADWEADTGDRLQERAAAAIDRIRTRVERSHPYFDDAYAIAVWPGITRIAFGFGQWRVAAGPANCRVIHDNKRTARLHTRTGRVTQ